MTASNDEASNGERREITDGTTETGGSAGDGAEGNGDGAYVRAVDAGSEFAGLDEDRYRLLVPVFAESPVESVERIIRAAATIADDRGGDLVVLSLVDVPNQTPSEAMTGEQPVVREAHETARRLLRIAEDIGVEASALVCLSHREAPAILDIADRYDCDGVFVIVETDRSQRRRLLAGDTVETVVSRAKCDVFVQKPSERERPTERIQLAVSGGPHSGLAAETARALALAADARIDVVHFLDTNATDADRADGETILGAARETLADGPRVETELVGTDDVAAAMISRSNGYDVTVLGAPTMGLLTQFVFGTVPDSVSRGTENAVVMAKQQPGVTSAYDRWIAGHAE